MPDRARSSGMASERSWADYIEEAAGRSCTDSHSLHWMYHTVGSSKIPLFSGRLGWHAVYPRPSLLADEFATNHGTHLRHVS